MPRSKMFPCVINQDSSHDLSGNCEKMCTIPPALALIHQFQIRFVNQRGSLQSVIASLPAHVSMSQTMQLFFDQRQELLFGRTISFTPGGEQFSYLFKRSLISN